MGQIEDIKLDITDLDRDVGILQVDMVDLQSDVERQGEHLDEADEVLANLLERVTVLENRNLRKGD